MPETSVLELSGIGVPLYSARGLQQTLEPIQAATSLRRTINGTLVDLSAEQFRKFASTITGSDQQPIAADGVWPGKLVTVDCIAQLGFEEPTGFEVSTEGDDTEGYFQRTPVPGSIRVENGFVFYRPRLSMIVVGYSTQEDEYGAIISWSLQLEEV